MSNKNLYIISGCNGAGKTTASFNILPDILACDEFINADEIARGISPFKPDSVALQAGRLMLGRIEQLLNEGKDFAFETTLSTRSYKNTVLKAQSLGYHVTLLFYWLESPELAQKRVEFRVQEGGHNIPLDVINRRYLKGISNLFEIYLPICDYSMVFDNSKTNPVMILDAVKDQPLSVHDEERLSKLKSYIK